VERGGRTGAAAVLLLLAIAVSGCASQQFGRDEFGAMVARVARIEQNLGIFDLNHFTPQVDPFMPWQTEEGALGRGPRHVSGLPLPARRSGPGTGASPAGRPRRR